jgi:hypothetical protein
MSTSSFPGVARTLYVRPRLRLADAPCPGATDWALIKGTIDAALDELAMTVKARRQDIIVRTGSHSAGAVHLFDYRTFRCRDRPDADPIVAGVTFVDHDGAIRGRADLSHEASGVVVGGEMERELRGEDDVEDVAARLAAHLARLADDVIGAVDRAPDEPT